MAWSCVPTAAAKAVKVYQFMKVPSARFGEHRLFDQLGIPIEGFPGEKSKVGRASITHGVIGDGRRQEQL